MGAIRLTHYCINLVVYKGAHGTDKVEIKKLELGYYVVNKLLQMAGLLKNGYHIFL